MNTGIISSRYAKALFKLSEDTGSSDEVAAQVKIIMNTLQLLPKMQRALDDPAISDTQKITLCQSSLNGEALCPSLKKFITLLLKNGRTENIRFIFHDFLSLYYKSKNIKICRLVTAVESKELEDKITKLLAEATGSQILMETVVNQDIIGGFIIEVDDYLLDASVSRQLEQIRNQFVQKNRRIV